MMVHACVALAPFADISKRTSRLAANLCLLTVVDVSPAACAQVMLGIYEMGRIELLRDLLIWTYERSTQE